MFQTVELLLTLGRQVGGLWFLLNTIHKAKHGCRYGTANVLPTTTGVCH